MSNEIVFLDTETTSLDDERGEVWEIGLIDDLSSREYCWQIRPDLTTADPNSLRISGYYRRNHMADHLIGDALRLAHPYHVGAGITTKAVAQELAMLLAGKTVIGAVPDFDYRFLRKFLARHGEVWTAHYHLIDIEAMAAGYLIGRNKGHAAARLPTVSVELPWKSDDLSRELGVEPTDFLRHTALGDCRWVRAQYRVMTEPVPA